jgi:hypothetical protein
MSMALFFIGFMVSAIITTALISACALSGRQQEVQGPMFDYSDFTPLAMPAIAEVHLPMRHLQGTLSPQQA